MGSFFRPNVSVKDDDVLFLNGCELKAIVDFTGVCRFSGDPGDKATTLVKNLAELTSQPTAPASQPSDPAVKPVNEDQAEQFKRLYHDSLKFAVEPKYDFCGGTTTTYPGYAKDNCMDEGGYTLEKSKLGLLTKDTVPLCISTSAPLVTALKEENLPSCIRQAFKEQEVRLQASGEGMSEANTLKLNEFGKLCAETIVPVYDEDLGQYILLYPTYVTNDPLTGAAYMPMIVSLEWACGTALTALFTKSDYEAVGKVSNEPSQSFPWGMPPEPKKPEGVKDLETCFTKNLGGLRWNKWVEVNQFCVQAVDEQPWAYTWAAIGGTTLAAVLGIMTRYVFKLAAFIFSKKMLDAVIDKSFWATDGIGGLGKRIKDRFKKIGQDIAKRWRARKGAPAEAPKGTDAPKMIAIDPKLIPILLPTPALQPSMNPSPITTAIPQEPIRRFNPSEFFKPGKPPIESIPIPKPETIRDVSFLAAAAAAVVAAGKAVTKYAPGWTKAAGVAAVAIGTSIAVENNANASENYSMEYRRKSSTTSLVGDMLCVLMGGCDDAY